MAKGFKEHQARQAALSALGRPLARRSRSCCEVCLESGVPLEPFEVSPSPEEPDIERTVFACETCRTALSGSGLGELSRWRCLEQTMWSEVPAAQVCAVRLLRKVAETEEWASRSLEDLYLEPEVEEWVEKDA